MELAREIRDWKDTSSILEEEQKYFIDQTEEKGVFSKEQYKGKLKAERGEKQDHQSNSKSLAPLAKNKQTKQPIK